MFVVYIVAPYCTGWSAPAHFSWMQPPQLLPLATSVKIWLISMIKCPTQVSGKGGCVQAPWCLAAMAGGSKDVLMPHSLAIGLTSPSPFTHTCCWVRIRVDRPHTFRLRLSLPVCWPCPHPDLLSGVSFNGRRRICSFVVSATAQDAQNSQPLRLGEAWNVRGLKAIRGFVIANYLPLVLVTGVVVGLVSPGPGHLAQRQGLSKWSTSGIFFISGLSLRSGEMKRAAQAWPVASYALASILLITPLAAIPVLHFSLTPKELSTGLAIFFCVPTTLSSAVSLTQLAGANAALALALTITSNLLGIFTMPLLLSRLFMSKSGVSIPAGPLFQSLVQTILVPLLVGKLFRSLFGLGTWVDGRKKQLSLLNSSFLALVPWMQVSCSKALLLEMDLLNLGAAAIMGTTIHLLYLAGNTAMMQLMAAFAGRTKDEITAAQRAVVLVASQKTLPVAVAVIGKLGGTLGEAGILVLPCIALHVIQIMIDSYLVSYWVKS